MVVFHWTLFMKTGGALLVNIKFYKFYFCTQIKWYSYVMEEKNCK